MYCVYLGRATATQAPAAGSVNTAAIVDLNVTTGKIAADAITEAKIADDAVESEHLNDNVISGQTELASEPADTDEFLVSDAGTLKRIDYSLIKGGGIANVDRWTMSNQTYNSEVMDSGWSRVTTLNGLPHGTGLTESSGVFTFPTTGLYYISVMSYTYMPSSVKSYVGIEMQGSSDGFSSNSQGLGVSYGNIPTNGYHDNIHLHTIYEITNTSNNKFRLAASQNSNPAGYYQTYVTFIRLADV
jgi:hypothetical protein